MEVLGLSQEDVRSRESTSFEGTGEGPLFAVRG
jgi:hypothetical protein